jgi:putative Ca2+/H+ antiporter (TMEM165/GDT1 family)
MLQRSDPRLPSFFLALIAAALATLGGREAVRVARLSAALGGGGVLLAAGVLACLIACLLAARLGAGIAGELPPDGKTMLVALALLLAGLELLLLGPGRAPSEPTRSFGAVLLVLSAAQLTAAAGFLVFALAAATGSPWLAAAGGTVGSGGVFTAAWSMGAEWEPRMPLRLLRFGVGGVLVCAALVAGLSARGLL